MNVSDNSSFISNKAGGSGGGVAITQLTKNTPANLNMKYLPAYTIPPSDPFCTNSPTPCPVPALCYDTINATNGTDTFRQYDYASPYALFDSTLFDSNWAIGAGASGGALYALDVRVNISRSNITSNQANLTGGGIYLESGTAALVVTGTSDDFSNINNNTASSGGRYILAVAGT